jgi:hypothetical protein
MIAIGVEMKPIVVPPPRRADLAGLLQPPDIQPCRAHRAGASESRGACADNDGAN